MEKLIVDKNDRIIVSSGMENTGQHDRIPDINVEIKNNDAVIEAEVLVQSLFTNFATILQQNGLAIDASAKQLNEMQQKYVKIEARWENNWDKLTA